MLARVGKILLWGFVGVLLVLAVLPFILMVVSSLQETTKLTFFITPKRSP